MVEKRYQRGTCGLSRWDGKSNKSVYESLTLSSEQSILHRNTQMTPIQLKPFPYQIHSHFFLHVHDLLLHKLLQEVVAHGDVHTQLLGEGGGCDASLHLLQQHQGSAEEAEVHQLLIGKL